MRKLSKMTFTLILRWMGVKINWPGQLTPTPVTKYKEQSDKENS